MSTPVWIAIAIVLPLVLGLGPALVLYGAARPVCNGD